MKKIMLLVVAAVFIFSACDAAPQEVSGPEQKQETAATTVKPTIEPSPEPTPEPLPNKVAVVVCSDIYAAEEFHPVMDALVAAGYETVITSDKLGKSNGGNETVDIAATFSDFKGSDLKGVVVIGGSFSLWDNAELHRLLCEVNDLGRVTAGICLNAVTLAKAGVIEAGEKACWANHPTLTDPVMAELGITDSGELVTVSGNVITGNGPPASMEFAAQVVKALDAM